MKFFLLFILFLSFNCAAQLVFEINEPVSQRGVYPCMAPNANWNCPNLYLNGNWFSDTIVIANDGVTGSACNSLLGSVLNNYAIFYRNACNFDDQLLNVQNAGASGAIIIDNVVGRPLPFDVLPQSANITIPFVVISSDEGDSIVAAINNGETSVVSFGDKTGIAANDLGIYMESSIWSSYGYFRLEGETFFTDTILGAWIFNQGSITVTDAQLRFYLKGKSSPIYYNVISDPHTILAGDSIYIPISFPQIIDFNIENEGLDYGYDIISTISDEDTLDNHNRNELLFAIETYYLYDFNVASPSFYNHNSSESEFDYKIEFENFTWTLMAYAAKRFQDACIQRFFYSDFDEIVTLVDNWIIDYNTVNYNDIYNSIWTPDITYAFNYQFMPNSGLNGTYLMDGSESTLDTLGFITYTEGFTYIPFTTDMYHDEKRRRYPEEEVRLFINDTLINLDYRLTPCVFYSYLNGQGHCTVSLNEVQSENLNIIIKEDQILFKSDYQIISLEIFDIVGKKIDLKFINNQDNSIVRNLFPSGMYYASILFNNGSGVGLKFYINN